MQYTIEFKNDDFVINLVLGLLAVFMTLVSLVQHKNLVRAVALRKELESAKKEAELSARIDMLTGVYNRRAFFEIAPPLVDAINRYHQQLTVVMMDIDHFKEVNDTFGHFVGDKVLIRIAEILKSNIRDTDVVARYGGEEFVILLQELEQERAYLVIERLREKIEAIPFSEYQSDLTVTASFGLAFLADDAETLDELIIRADTALYSAKDQGRNRTEIFKPELIIAE